MQTAHLNFNVLVVDGAVLLQDKGLFHIEMLRRMFERFYFEKYDLLVA